MVTITIKAAVMVLMLTSFACLLFSIGYQLSLAQVKTNNLSTYNNPDLGLTMQYPSNWIKQKDNLVRNTIAAFILKENQFHNSLDFANITLAEVDLRVYPAPQNESSANLNIGQINTQGQAILSHYKNSTTTVGGLPALKIVSYLFGSFTQKALQVWTYVPSKHVLLEVIYTAQPSQYPLYLPAVQGMIDSVKLAH